MRWRTNGHRCRPTPPPIYHLLARGRTSIASRESVVALSPTQWWCVVNLISVTTVIGAEEEEEGRENEDHEAIKSPALQDKHTNTPSMPPTVDRPVFVFCLHGRPHCQAPILRLIYLALSSSIISDVRVSLSKLDTPEHPEQRPSSCWRYGS